jgi:hypothetical protein
MQEGQAASIRQHTSAYEGPQMQECQAARSSRDPHAEAASRTLNTDLHAVLDWE